MASHAPVEVRGDDARDDADGRTARLSKGEELFRPPKPASHCLPGLFLYGSDPCERSAAS
jgi:hypothetical protein